MSRHYNTTHPERSRTDETKGYRKRLQSRGLSKAPRMADVADLRNKQERRIRETCTITHEHDTDNCNGLPFPYADEANSPAGDSPEAKLLKAIYESDD